MNNREIFDKALEQIKPETPKEKAIERIKVFCSREKPLLAFSGGKDSQAVYHLTIEALGRSNFEAQYNVSMEAPEVKQFIRRVYPDVTWAKHPDFNFYKALVYHGYPRRLSRWCCEYMKEWAGSGRLIITGLRADESSRRRHYGIVEHRGKSRLSPVPKALINPIIDWTSKDVWAYLQELGVEYTSVYDEGASGKYKGDGIFRRVGCVLCPMASAWEKKQELVRWPKIAEAWRSAFHRLYDDRMAKESEAIKRWKDADEMFWHYVHDTKPPSPNQYCFAFE